MHADLNSWNYFYKQLYLFTACVFHILFASSFIPRTILNSNLFSVLFEMNHLLDMAWGWLSSFSLSIRPVLHSYDHTTDFVYKHLFIIACCSDLSLVLPFHNQLFSFQSIDPVYMCE